MSNQKINLLNEWFSQSEGYVEFRLIGAKGLNDKRFIAVEDLTDTLLVDLIENGKQEQLNVYHSVTTRKTKSGTEEEVFHVPGL